YLIELSENIYLNKEALNKAKNIVIDYLNKNKSITIAEAKDQFATSRKMTIAILEYLDNAKITKRYENVRCLYN
ncbi:MAG: selenocysteine-specific translation elongation factor, partial [Tissierellia bacterium]|nr:selenocysteine-specific translation elongation factor [Tissierellia bacterium]